MKKRMILAGICLLAATALSAQNRVKGTYGYLYCHMSDRGEYTAYAVSRDGMNYQDILNGDAIMDPEEHARIEGGQRDAFITRSWDGKGYVMVTTERASTRTGRRLIACGHHRYSGTRTTCGRTARRVAT